MANNKIQIKRTSVSGRAANTTTLTNAGELALNMTDGIMYSTNGSVVFEIGANTTNARVTGNLTVKGIIANGSIGGDGQILASNGSAIYWTSDQIAGNISGNVITSSTLASNLIIVSTGTITVGNSTVNTDIGNNYISVGNSSSYVNIYSSYIYVGNSTANATVNSTIYTGSANNASYLGGTIAATYVKNTDSRTLSGNLNFSGANTNIAGNLTIASTSKVVYANSSATRAYTFYNANTDSIDTVFV